MKISKNSQKTIQLILLVSLTAIVVSFSSCWYYSFRGGSLSPAVKTVSVNTFTNQASQVVPSLSELLSEKLKDKFVKEMKLQLVDHDGDISFEGAIVDYKIAPASISGDQKAATTRLSISVKVKFVNITDEEKNYETTFSNYIDFESSQNLADIEDDLHEELTDMLIENIFNKAVNNW